MRPRSTASLRAGISTSAGRQAGRGAERTFGSLISRKIHRLSCIPDLLPADDSPVHRHDARQGVADDDGQRDEEDGEALDR